MKKKLFRLLICLMGFACLFVGLNVDAADGYMYSSDGKLIESSVGLTVTSDGIYGVLSDAWNGFTEDNAVTDFNSPSDMCLYTDPVSGKETLYVVDSDSNKLFVFDGSIRYQETISSFPLDPSLIDGAVVYKFSGATRNAVINALNAAECEYSEITQDEKGNVSVYTTKVDKDKVKNTLVNALGITNFEEDGKQLYKEAELAKINTRVVSGSSASKGKLWTNDARNAYSSEQTVPEVECLGLAGVYRNRRPLKDAEGVNVLDENGETVYQDVLYLCDKTNMQVLLLNPETYEVIQVISAPEGVDFADKFFPSKIVTDVTGRVYLICEGVYEGILLMSYQGEFMRMVGVNYTTLSVWDAIKRNFKTEEQLKQEVTILQTTFNNLTIDSKGFLYTVSSAVTNADGTVSDEAMIKRINQANTDVLKRNGYSKPKGDLITIKTGAQAGGSNFMSIAINEYGVYTVADSKHNRLFTYDNEGNLLYISGGKGSQVTDISNATAIAYQGENILVLDKGSKCIMRFEPTDFARSINRAVQYEFIGDATAAAEEWQNVISANPAYELAYVGVGKKLYSEGRYQEAMLQFEKGADVAYYSRAYKMYRDDLIKKYFPAVFVGILVLIVVRYVFKIRKKLKNRKAYDDGDFL